MVGEKQEVFWFVFKFYFKVIIGDKGEIVFQEVFGLDIEFDIVEYWVGNGVDFFIIKMFGIKKVSDVILKKGMFKVDIVLFYYFMEVKMNIIK